MVLTLVFAIILVLVGLYFVEKQRAVSPNGEGATWNTGGAYVEPTQTAPSDDSHPSLPDVTDDASPATLTIPTATATPPKKAPATTAQVDGTFDYNAMLAQLRHDTAQTPAQQANSTYEQLLDAFSFTPTLAVPASKARTAEQEAIFAYGNEVGLRLQGFAAVNPNMTATLTDQIKHRTDQALGDAVRDLGNRYKALGEGILAIKDVPPSMSAANQTLGQSYVNLGIALAAVPDATEDKAFIAAITAYNSKADAYTTAFIGMVTLFSAQNVTFESSDAGSAFSFRHN